MALSGLLSSYVCFLSHRSQVTASERDSSGTFACQREEGESSATVCPHADYGMLPRCSLLGFWCVLRVSDILSWLITIAGMTLIFNATIAPRWLSEQNDSFRCRFTQIGSDVICTSHRRCSIFY